MKTTQLANGMHVRPGTYDEFITKEVKGYSPLFTHLPRNYDGVILDIGAQCGAFSNLFGNRFPDADFHAFEPEPGNVALLNTNTEDLHNVKVYPIAVTHQDCMLKLYINQGKPGSKCINTGLHTTRPVRGRPSIEVAGKSFKDILYRLQPQIIKMDIEGGEFYLLDELTDLPDCVERIAIEIHLQGKTDNVSNKLLGSKLGVSLQNQFHTVVKGPRELPLSDEFKNWTMVMICKR